MPWIKRDDNNEIVALYKRKQYKGQQFLPDDDTEIVKFKNKNKKTESDDIEMKIRLRTRKLAIDLLKQEGELPQDYVDKVISEAEQKL